VRLLRLIIQQQLGKLHQETLMRQERLLRLTV
jgi:hypothetical protein